MWVVNSDFGLFPSFLSKQNMQFLLNSTQLCYSSPMTVTNLTKKNVGDQIIAFPVNLGLNLISFNMATWLLRNGPSSL